MCDMIINPYDTKHSIVLPENDLYYNTYRNSFVRLALYQLI